MKLTDEELKSLPKNCFDWNGKGGLVINKEILKSICSELLEYRKKDNGWNFHFIQVVNHG